MELRRLSEKDRSQAVILWDTCFGDGEEYIEWAFAHYFPLAEATGIFEEGRLVSAAYTRRCRLCDCGTEYRVPMIAGVATLPAFRSRGYSSMILKEILKERREAGDSLAVLNTYIPDFYRRLGFINIAPMDCYCVNEKDVVPGGAELCDKPDLLFLQACYREFCSQFSGYLTRDERVFSLRIQDCLGFGGKLFVSENGYMILDPKTGTAIETVCPGGKDLVALTAAAVRFAGKGITVKAPVQLDWSDVLGQPEKTESGAMACILEEKAKKFYLETENALIKHSWCILEEY